MKRILASLCSLALLSLTINADTPGITASIDLSLFEEAKDIYLAHIIDILNGMQEPDFLFDDGYMKNNSITIAENVQDVSLSAENNSFTLTVDNF